MAALVCDICGGKLIMGQGGIAFCDSCGLEYSQQRLKEKIIDGMDSVHSDHTSIIDHWMRMGKAASESGNYRGAYDYYVKVLELEPNNWRAIYEKGKSGAWQSTLDNLRTSELHQAVNEALIIIADLDLKEDEICQLKNEFAVELVKLNSFITDSVNDNFKIIPEKSFYMHWDKMWDRRERFISNISIVENAMLLIADYDDAVSKAHVIDFKKRVCSDLCMVCKPVGYWYDQGHTSLQYFGFNSFEKREYIEKFWDYVYDIREIEPDYRVKMSEQPDPFEPANNSDWDIYEYWQKHSDEQLARRERFYSKKRYDQYWEEHHEEKSQLLSRREEIKKELNSIKAQIYVFTSQIGEINKGRFEQLLSEKQLLDKKELLGELIDQRDTLSSFAGKQKKLLQEQIDVLKEQLSELEVIIAQQKAEIEAKSAERINQLKADSKPLRDREEALKTEMEEINRELAKAR